MCTFDYSAITFVIQHIDWLLSQGTFETVEILYSIANRYIRLNFCRTNVISAQKAHKWRQTTEL